MKQPKGNSEGLKVAVIIYGVIIAVIEILIIALPLVAGHFGEMFPLTGVLFFLLLGALLVFGFFGLIFLLAGWGHPKWYVKGYTAVCFLWECYWALWFIGGIMFRMHEDMTPIWLFNVLVVSAVPPLVPIWYWDYKKHRREEEKKKKEPKAWELEDQLKELKEQLSRGIITQEEYERKRKLLEKSGKMHV